MNVVNSTRLAAACAPGRMKDGRMCLVAVAKATYDFPTEPGKPLKLSKEQIGLLENDEYLGDPEIAPLHLESDFAPFKPKCDVIIIGHACAPDEQATPRVRVGARVGDWSKQFDVVGDRYWSKSLGQWKLTEPEPFVTKDLSWNVAFGGITQEKEDQADYYMLNPAGCGFGIDKVTDSDFAKAPNTEQIDDPITSSSKQYMPQSFGPVCRHWEPRRNFAGTYDDHWHEHYAPYLPPDFDEAFYQSAPADQQVPYLQGGESVTLQNLSKQSVLTFSIPRHSKVVMSAVKRGGKRVPLDVNIDTLTIDTKNQTITVASRARLPLEIDIKEVDVLLVGVPSPGWERARLTGKTYIPMSQLRKVRADVDGFGD
ncbi:MAG: DUF2169 domain-containing protein [Gammaproteobacteria bacterium]